MRPLFVLAICALCLVACGEGDDGGGSPSTAETTTPENNGPRNRAFAMREMEALSKRVCGSVSPEVLARSLGGTDFPKTDSSPNAISLGYARDVDISPVPLQRAAAEGCEAGVVSQMAGADAASGFPENCDRSPGVRRWPDGVDGLTCQAGARVLAEWEFDDTLLSECEESASAGFAHRAGEGVSCDRVDDFAAHEFAPHPAGWVEKRGPTTCRIRQASRGGLLVHCVQSSGAFSFKFA